MKRAWERRIAHDNYNLCERWIIGVKFCADIDSVHHDLEEIVFDSSKIIDFNDPLV